MTGLKIKGGYNIGAPVCGTFFRHDIGAGILNPDGLTKCLWNLLFTILDHFLYILRTKG